MLFVLKEDTCLLKTNRFNPLSDHKRAKFLKKITL